MVFKLAVNLKMITGAIEKVADIAMSSSGQKFICGTYSDGKPRSGVDAMRDEYVSPKDRMEYDKKKKNIGASFLYSKGLKRRYHLGISFIFLDAVFRDYMDDAFRTDNIHQDK